jgi:hypothetical protein
MLSGLQVKQLGLVVLMQWAVNGILDRRALVVCHPDEVIKPESFEGYSPLGVPFKA